MSDNQPEGEEKISAPVEANAEEEEEVFTGQEIADALDEREMVEKGLYGSQDETVCTWPEGYKPRQPLFSCLTCTPDTNNFAAICLGCSTNCHDGHDLVELYTKRKFRCDCGNEKFGDKKCTLYEEKSGLNELNIYNHNFAGKYCTCEDTFPGKLDETMYQCLMCEDWFHLTHQNIEQDSEKWKQFYNEGCTFVCCKCSPKYPFLSIFESALEKSCFEQVSTSVTNSLCLKKDWRTRVCSCSQCQSILERNDCLFLLDEEDDVEKFETDNIKHANEVTDAQVVDELVKLGGRDAAIEVIRGYHQLKQNLADFFQSKGDKVITSEDVHSFFDKIKRPRLERDDNE